MAYGDAYSYHDLPLGCMRGHSTLVDIDATPTSSAGSPPVEEGRSNSWPSDFFAHIYDSQINREAGPLAGYCRASLESTDTDVQEYPTPFYQPVQPLANHVIGEKGGSPLLENPIAGIPYTQPESAMQGPEGLMPISGIRIGNFLNNAHLHPRIETASDFPVPSALPSTSSMRPPTQQRAGREPQDRPHQSKRARKKGVAGSSQSSRRPTNMHESPKRSFSNFPCDTCGKTFAQPQGVTRHYREKHNPSLCIYCDVEWSRPYQYKDHLEKHHPGVDPVTVLGKTAGSRRRTSIIARHPPPPPSPPQDLPPIVDLDVRGHSEIRPYLPVLPLPVVTESSTVTSPALLSLTYVPQHEFAQRTLARKDSHEEEHSQTTQTTSLGAGRIECGRISGGYAGHPSIPKTALITALTPPVGGYHGSPDFVRMVEPAGSVYYRPLSAAGFDEIRTFAPKE